MKKITLLILFIFSFLFGFGQSDTVFLKYSLADVIGSVPKPPSQNKQVQKWSDKIQESFTNLAQTDSQESINTIADSLFSYITGIEQDAVNGSINFDEAEDLIEYSKEVAYSIGVDLSPGNAEKTPTYFDFTAGIAEVLISAFKFNPEIKNINPPKLENKKANKLFTTLQKDIKKFIESSDIEVEGKCMKQIIKDLAVLEEKTQNGEIDSADKFKINNYLNQLLNSNISSTQPLFQIAGVEFNETNLTKENMRNQISQIEIPKYNEEGTKTMNKIKEVHFAYLNSELDKEQAAKNIQFYLKKLSNAVKENKITNAEVESILQRTQDLGNIIGIFYVIVMP